MIKVRLIIVQAGRRIEGESHEDRGIKKAEPGAPLFRYKNRIVSNNRCQVSTDHMMVEVPSFT